MSTEAIAATLNAYATALNASDTEAVMALYTPDAVFMPQNFPSSIGTAAITEAYRNIFAAITLTVTFTIAEIIPVSDGYAFARTNSAGQVLIHANGVTTAEANQELFVLQNLNGSWKIARYCFSTTNPPSQA